MTRIVGVRFKKAGKVYYFNPKDIDLAKDDHVIVETSRGLKYGEVVVPPKEIEEDKLVSPLKDVIRKATDKDAVTVAENEKKEKEAFRIASEKIQERNMDMRLVTVEYTFDRSKILFYFTADGRVDFRELVKELAAIFKTRIELRQIGVRDEAKMIGGLGVCGRPLCCAQFMGDFQPVSINMAKDQNLSLNPTKISGTCGRLMCCLKFEEEVYTYLNQTTPRIDSIVETPDGIGKVVEVNLLKGICKVQLDEASDDVKCFCKENCIIRKQAKNKESVPEDTDADLEI